MRLVSIGAFMVLLLAAPAAFAVSNAPGDLGGTVGTVIHEGSTRTAIVVYTDDYQGYDYVIQALNGLGLAYTAYYSDYAGFEAAVATGAYDLILVNHDNWYELSYAWDTILAELNAGKTAIITTFDCDGSNDYSGYMSALLAYAGHTWSYDWGSPPTIYGWNHIANPWWAGMSASISGTDAYMDDGDGLHGAAATSFAGSTPAYSEPDVMMNIHPCDLILACWCADEYPAAEAILWWTNCITWITVNPSPVGDGTWGAIKALYR